MGVQFEPITYSSENSLTLIVDDIVRQRRDGIVSTAEAQADMESWLNALHRQAAPLIYSKSGHANLEAWLAAVEQDLLAAAAE